MVAGLGLGDAAGCNINLSYTPKLENLLAAVEKDDNRKTKVIIATMTNNAKDQQPVSKCLSLLQKAVTILKTQTLAKNITFLESPPSLNFDIFPFNQMAFHLCQKLGMVFCLNLLARPHIKPDGLHIKAPFKHLMLKSVAAAVVGKGPYSILGLIPPIRRPVFPLIGQQINTPHRPFKFMLW